MVAFVVSECHLANFTRIICTFTCPVTKRRTKAVPGNVFVLQGVQKRAYGVCVHDP
ncbi:hypothetical protein D9M71_753170 [compost metagenome]